MRGTIMNFLIWKPYPIGTVFLTDKALRLLNSKHFMVSSNPIYIYLKNANS